MIPSAIHGCDISDDSSWSLPFRSLFTGEIPFGSLTLSAFALTPVLASALNISAWGFRIISLWYEQ